MSKGAGGGGHGGGGGAAAAVRSVISSHGGVTGFASIPTRAPGQQKQRTIDHYAAQLSGAKTTAAKNRITAGWKPITMGISKRNGKWSAGVDDGAHRIAAARAGGATKIRAEVTFSSRRGNEKTVTTMVKI